MLSEDHEYWSQLLETLGRRFYSLSLSMSGSRVMLVVGYEALPSFTAHYLASARPTADEIAIALNPAGRAMAA